MGLAFDIRYVISLPYGVLRFAALVIAVIVLICLSPIEYTDGIKSLIWFTASGSSISSAVFLILFIIHFPQTFQRLPWAIVEFAVSVFWTVFYAMSFITSCALSSKYSNWTGSAHAGYGASAFFCLLNLFAYGAISYLLFKMWRGGITIEQTTTTVTSSTTAGAKY